SRPHPGRHRAPHRGRREARPVRRLAVLGSGSWGTALAIHLARSGGRVRLWGRSAGRVGAIAAARENAAYLPGHRLPEGVEGTGALGLAVEEASLVLLVVPAQASREIFREAGSAAPADADLVIASKGIEEKTLLRLTQVMEQEAGASAAARTAVLSGPSFA